MLEEMNNDQQRVRVSAKKGISQRTKLDMCALADFFHDVTQTKNRL